MKKIIRSFAFALLTVPAAAQTATDACAFNAGNEYDVSENSCQLQPFNVPSNFVHNYNPNICSSGFNRDAYGWFTATSTTTVVRYVPEVGRPLIIIFSGACNALTPVGCHASPAAGIPAQVVLTTVVGQAYMIRAQNLQVNGTMSGSICVYNPPANDHCINSEELMVSDTCHYLTYTSIGATNTNLAPSPACGGFGTTSMDIWFHFYAPANGIVEINTAAGTLTDAAMQLYQNGCGSLTLVECNDDSGPGLMPRIDRNCNPLVPNALYTIRLWGKSGTTGSFDICVMSKPAYQTPQQDCAGGTTICNSQTINSTTESRGCTQDLNSTNRGCLISNERQGVWYRFSPTAPGTIEFTITPIDGNGNVTNVDYDFALWDSGTQITCPPTSSPIRCSYASAVNSGSNIGAGTYLTGLKNGELDLSEPAFNGVNGFVQPLIIPPAHVGKIFILYVDNFDTNNQRFRLDWTLTGGSSLNCVALPVELIDFQATAQSDLVLLSWTTMSENNSDHFVIERSSDGIDFTPIGTTEAAGYSMHRIDYKWADEEPLTGLSYYRLKQTDVDGSWQLSAVVAVNYSALSDVVIYPNPSDGLINVQLEEANTGIQETRIYHISGKLVSTMRHNDKNGGSKNIPISFLETGTYYIEVIDALGQSRMGRFMKQ